VPKHCFRKAASSVTPIGFAFQDIRSRHRYCRHYACIACRPVERLAPPSWSRLLDVGCGTARNFVVAARSYPDVHFYGIDISDPDNPILHMESGAVFTVRIARTG
jgi:SAM-dependent methyltransferase